MSKADQQNSLPKCAGETLGVREEKLWFMLSAYAHIPAYHLCAHRMQKQEEERVVYHAAHIMGDFSIINCILHKCCRTDRKTLCQHVSVKVRKQARGGGGEKKKKKVRKKDFTEFKYPWVGFTSFTEIHSPKC